MELMERKERKEWIQEIPIDGTTGSLAVRRLSFNERGRYGKLRHYRRSTKKFKNRLPFFVSFVDKSIGRFGPDAKDNRRGAA